VINLKPINKVKPKKGSLLLAEPFLTDPYFKRAVVLLCEHNNEGSFGFVLNRFLDFELNELIDNDTFKSNIVGLGGPVNKENLFYLHAFGSQVAGSVKITDDIYFGGDFNQLKSAYKADLKSNVANKKIRFFVGYSGWDNQQLKQELAEDSWLICNKFNADDIYSLPSESLWEKIIKSFGNEYSVWLNAPYDPILN